MHAGTLLTTMKLLAALLTLLPTAIHAKEELLRRRDLNLAVAWDPKADDKPRASNEHDEHFFRGREWGQDEQPHYNGEKESESSQSSKSPTSKGSEESHRPPHPSMVEPPTGPPPPGHHCPHPPKLDYCELSADKDSCGVHTSCKPTCTPKFCKLPPSNSHKIHGWDGENVGDKYVKLGDVCGWFDYVVGEPLPRHEVEVCCETTGMDSDPHFGECAACGGCLHPQKVDPACCALANKNDGMDRAGDFGGCPSPGKPVCCKCGVNEYACIGVDEHCTDTCPTLAPTEPPTPAPSPLPQCTLPKTHKIHGYKSDGIDHVVDLGDICGSFHYVKGEHIGRHEVEVCCKVDETLDFLLPPEEEEEEAQCVGCADCNSHQLVNDVCCKIALGVEVEGEPAGRDGVFKPHCPQGQNCCKCGPGNGRSSYNCIPQDEICAISSCVTTTLETSDTTSTAGVTSTTADSTTTTGPITNDATTTTEAATTTTTRSTCASLSDTCLLLPDVASKQCNADSCLPSECCQACAAPTRIATREDGLSCNNGFCSTGVSMCIENTFPEDNATLSCFCSPDSTTTPIPM